jgi:hypothetical protein
VACSWTLLRFLLVLVIPSISVAWLLILALTGIVYNLCRRASAAQIIYPLSTCWHTMATVAGMFHVNHVSFRCWFVPVIHECMFVVSYYYATFNTSFFAIAFELLKCIVLLLLLTSNFMLYRVMYIVIIWHRKFSDFWIP